MTLALLWILIAVCLVAAFALTKKDAELLAEIERNDTLTNQLADTHALLNQAKSDAAAYRGAMLGAQAKADALTAELEDAKAKAHPHCLLEALRNATGNHDIGKPTPVRKTPRPRKAVRKPKGAK